MFENIDFPSVDRQLRQAWHALLRIIQSEVEHKRVTNTSGVDIVKGDVMYIEDGDREVDLAIATAGATSDWVGVMSEDVVSLGRGIMRTEGYALVHIQANDVLANQEGNIMYVSAATAGRATITDPLTPNFTKRIGILADATAYNTVTNPFAWVFLSDGCTLVEVA